MIEAAARLFLTKGYDRTAVRDIVRSVDVAQGTFYYHFDSKVDILEAVIRETIFALIDELKIVADRADIDAIEKMNQFYAALVRFSMMNKELHEAIHYESNLILHERLSRITMSHAVPLLSKILREGDAAGEFDTPFPDETARLLLLSVSYMFHDTSLVNDPERLERSRLAVERSVARIVGIREGEFRLRF